MGPRAGGHEGHMGPRAAGGFDQSTAETAAVTCRSRAEHRGLNHCFTVEVAVEALSAVGLVAVPIRTCRYMHMQVYAHAGICM